MDYKIIEKFKRISTLQSVYNNKYLYGAIKNVPGSKLTPIQSNVLSFLANFGETTIGRLAESTSTSTNYLSNAIKGLYKNNLIERYQKHNNLRFVYLKLTEEGSRLYDERQEYSTIFLNQQLSKIANEEEVEKMTECLKYVYEILKRLDNCD
jgi:DNA-binding MarR family transcriptional regulator